MGIIGVDMRWEQDRSEQVGVYQSMYERARSKSEPNNELMFLAIVRVDMRPFNGIDDNVPGCYAIGNIKKK